MHFEDVPTGRYQVEVTSIGPIEQTAGAEISSAAAVRSESFPLTHGDTVIVELG